MRALLILLFTLGLLVPVYADVAGHAAAAPAAKAGKVIKVLPLWLDQQGRTATSPSLFDRDAYQFYLLNHTNEISAIRYDVLWVVAQDPEAKLRVRAELRGVGNAGVPKFKTLETAIPPGSCKQWTSLTLDGDDFKQFGAIVAWRVTLWNHDDQIGEQQSFLW